LLEVDSDLVRENYSLTDQENIDALLAIHAIESQVRSMQIDVFWDMRNMLLGHDERTTCVWNACDPYTTRAVRGIEGFGQRSNCGRTNKDGIDFTKADESGFERYLALYMTPQEYGGCQSCRFFLMCKGQCPGTAIGGDWRNRTEHCRVWMTLFEVLESELIAEGDQPISLLPERIAIEQEFVDNWSRGTSTSMARVLRSISNRDKRLQFAQSFIEMAEIIAREEIGFSAAGVYPRHVGE
jgi:uncharacterized protein